VLPRPSPWRVLAIDIEARKFLFGACVGVLAFVGNDAQNAQLAFFTVVDIASERVRR